MTTRVTSARVAEITGYSARWVQKNATRIPGAIRLGSQWRFDEAKIERWIKQAEVKPCRSTDAGRSGGTSSNGRAGQFESHLDRLLRR